MKNIVSKFLISALCVLLSSAAFAQGQRVNVSGKVVDSQNGEPLIGVTIVTETMQGATTSWDGTYTISANAGTTLTFSYMGYKDAAWKIPTDKGATITHNVELHSDSEVLDDVVVIAYAVRKKGTVAGSVATVKAEKVESTPTAAFDQALQGQVAGLSVLSNSGEPSAAATMTIRGTNSINSGTAPLYILDGVPISASDFNTINPADIESLSVLKDASSTSIYGARAANGVIVITTKRGKVAERPRIDYRMQLGFSQADASKWDLMTTAERIEYEKQTGMTAGQNYQQLSKVNINWMDEVFNSTAPLQNYELSISGADDKTNYYISGGYYSQDGTAVGSSFERFSMRANLQRKAADWLTVGTNTMLNYQKIQQADEGAYTLVTPISAARFMLPYWNPRKEDGSLASIADGSWKGNGQNPLEWLENNPVHYNKYKLLTTLFAEAKPIEGLVIRSQFGVDYSHTTGFGVSYPSYMPNQGNGSASRSSTDGYNLTITNTANYTFSIDDEHNFTFLLGQEGVDYHYEAFSLLTEGQNNDRLTNISTGTRATSWDDTTDSDYGFLSFFSRGEYNYDNRLYAEAAFRLDGSSRFGKSRRWGAFWSMGLMWDMRREEFLIPYTDWLTHAQVSFSTGTSGNSSIPNYEHLALVGGGADYMGDAGVGLMQPGNEELGWEKPWTTNFGIHAGLWGRLTVDLELYYKLTSDMLMEVPQPYSTSGFGYYWDNVGEMVNKGVELNLTGTILATEDFLWTANANISYNHNEITELYNGVQEYERSGTNTKLVVGHPLGEYYINRYAGVNPANGEALWYTKDGKLTNELRDEDKVMLGKTYIAPWQGGFGTALTYKGLSLSTQFSWVADRWVLNNDRYFDESNGRFATYNQSRRLLDRWQQPGDVTDIPRHGEYTEFDSRLLEDASFLRLKNVMLSYSLPSHIIERQNIFRGVRIYAQAQNLLTFTHFSGLDPEGTSNIYAAQYPMARQYTFGLDVTF